MTSTSAPRLADRAAVRALVGIDIAEQEVQAGSTPRSALAPDLPAPPVYSKANPADRRCSPWR